LPGGSVEEGETRAQCAFRECLEEVGVRPELVSARKTFQLADENLIGIAEPTRGEVAPLTRHTLAKGDWSIDGAGFIAKYSMQVPLAIDALAVVKLKLSVVRSLPPTGPIEELFSKVEVVSAKNNYKAALLPNYSVAPGLKYLMDQPEMLSELSAVTQMRS
jgi:8-oxo-dGTP pyrophosphatase MutT (NUDIX family)